VFRHLSPPERKFEVSATSKRKESSPRARLPCNPPSSTALQPLVPTDRRLNVGQTSLSPVAPGNPWTANRPRAKRPFQGGFPRGLGPAYPCPSTVHMETDSAPVFCVLDRIIATTTKICTRCTIHADSRPALLLVPHAPPTQLWRASTSVQLAYHG
jgi:hypothetical protein